MAEPWSSIVSFLEALGSNFAYLLLFLAFIALLIIWLTVRHIRKIRNEPVWIHQAWGARWRGR